MHDAIYAIGTLAALTTFIAGLRTVRQREPLWPLLSGGQFGLTGMMILLVISNGAHSAALDLLDMAYALSFITYALYVWNVQKRSMASR